MPGLRPLKVRAVVRILQKLGFSKSRQKGSHAIFTHPDGRMTVVPIHAKEIGCGLLRKIIADCGLKPDEFMAYQ